MGSAFRKYVPVEAWKSATIVGVPLKTANVSVTLVEGGAECRGLIMAVDGPTDKSFVITPASYVGFGRILRIGGSAEVRIFPAKKSYLDLRSHEREPIQIGQGAELFVYGFAILLFLEG